MLSFIDFKRFYDYSLEILKFILNIKTIVFLIILKKVTKNLKKIKFKSFEHIDL